MNGQRKRASITIRCELLLLLLLLLSRVSRLLWCVVGQLLLDALSLVK
jgi:hypothetical protein